MDEVGEDAELVLAEGGGDLLVPPRRHVLRPVEAGEARFVAEPLMPSKCCAVCSAQVAKSASP